MILEETMDLITLVADSAEYIEPCAELCGRLFSQHCPSYKGIGLDYQYVRLVSQLSAQVSLAEKQLICMIDKENRRLVSCVIALSVDGLVAFNEKCMQKQEEFDKYNYKPLLHLLENVEMGCIKDLEKPIHLFQYTTEEGFWGRGLGEHILQLSIEYFASLGYKYMFAESTNIRSEKVLRKVGATSLKSYYYKNFEYEGKRFYSQDDNERLSHMRLKIAKF